MGCGTIQTVTDTLGITDYEGQQASRDMSQQNMQFSQNLTTEQLKFQKEQYDDWKAIYGDLQENLGAYYKNLSPDTYVAKGVTAVNQEYAAANKAITTELAQRGITNSGAAAAAITTLNQQKAGAIANIRATADQAVADDKMKFLGLGLGQGTQMLGINANVANTGAGAASGLAGTALGVTQKYSSANMDVMGNIVGAGTSYFV